MSSRQSILVVDDEAGPRRSLKAILAERFTVVTCATGADAIRYAAEHPGAISAAFVDYGMPEMDGGVVCTALRSLDATVGLIGFSGNQDAHFGVSLSAMLWKGHMPADHVLALADSVVCSVQQLRRKDGPATRYEED